MSDPGSRARSAASVAERVDVGPLYGRVARAVQELVTQGITEPSFDQVCAGMGLLSAHDLTLQVYNQVGRAMTFLGWKGKRQQAAY